MSPELLRIVLEVDLRREPIEGSMTVEGIPVRSFSGWMGLTRALELALNTANQATTNQ